MSKEEPYGSIGNLSNIYYYFTKDNCYPDSITLWYVNTTLRVCMYIIRSTLLLYQWGKESFIHKYMSKQEYMSLSETYFTNPIQIDLCPQKVKNCYNSSIIYIYRLGLQ